jgi:NAD(P)-dependent dehydrogenase (short-subunit alcohol dehydrogenase family)
MTDVVWCTGAGKGIGRATALLLARRGALVAASARTRADLDSLALAARDLAGTIFPYPLDVTDESAVRATVEAIEREHAPISLAILNAGTHEPVTARTFRVETVRHLVETNLMSVVYGLAALMPRFIERRQGHISVVASVAGYRGLPSAAAYGATKAALINMCEALAPELRRDGVRLSLVNPGFVRTPLTDRNEFPMPFLMDVDKAAARLVAGLDAGRFEITFPRRFTILLKLLRCLPYPLYFALTSRLIRD